MVLKMGRSVVRLVRANVHIVPQPAPLLRFKERPAVVAVMAAEAGAEAATLSDAVTESANGKSNAMMEI